MKKYLSPLLGGVVGLIFISITKDVVGGIIIGVILASIYEIIKMIISRH